MTEREAKIAIAEARELAAQIRLDWSRYENVPVRERKAATYLLTLADELERARPELKPEEEC